MVGRVSRRGVKENRRSLVKLPDLLTKIEPRSVRQPRIEQIQVKLFGGGESNSALDCATRYDFVALLAEEQGHELARIFVILNVEDSGLSDLHGEKWRL